MRVVLTLALVTACGGTKSEQPVPSGSGSGTGMQTRRTLPPPADASLAIDAAPAVDAAAAVDAAPPPDAAFAVLPLPAPDCAALLTPKVLAKARATTATSIEGGCAIARAGKPLLSIDLRCAPLGPEWWDRAKALLPPMPASGPSNARDTRAFGFDNEGIPCISAATGPLPFDQVQAIHEPIRAALKPYIVATYNVTSAP